MRRLILAAGLLTLLTGAASGVAPPHLDADAILSERFGNDAAWYRGNVPLFASSDRRIDAVYYYRWSIVRAHQRDLGEQGFVRVHVRERARAVEAGGTRGRPTGATIISIPA